MSKSTYENLTNEQLIKTRNSLKTIAWIGLGAVPIIAISILIYFSATKGLKNFPVLTLVPIFLLPVAFMPLLMSLGRLNKEVKNRNL